MASAVVTIELVTFGEARTGVWCHDCLLPSAVEVDVRLVSGMHVLGTGTVWGCRDCGREELQRG